MTIRPTVKKLLQQWRRGIVVIASAYRTGDPGFESRQGVRFWVKKYTPMKIYLPSDNYFLQKSTYEFDKSILNFLNF
jgi:hypothetical protein